MAGLMSLPVGIKKGLVSAIESAILGGVCVAMFSVFFGMPLGIFLAWIVDRKWGITIIRSVIGGGFVGALNGVVVGFFGRPPDSKFFGSFSSFVGITLIFALMGAGGGFAFGYTICSKKDEGQ